MNATEKAALAAEQFRRAVADAAQSAEADTRGGVLVRCRLPMDIPLSSFGVRRKQAGEGEQARAIQTRAVGPNGGTMIGGVASSTSVDWYGTEMSEKALRSMAEQFQRGVALLPSHGGWFESIEWDGQIGITTGAALSAADVENPYNPNEAGFALAFEGELYTQMNAKDEPVCEKAVMLVDRLEAGQVIGCSIGGWFREVRYIEGENGAEDRMIIEAVDLDHLAIVRQPANPDANKITLLSVRDAGRSMGIATWGARSEGAAQDTPSGEVPAGEGNRAEGEDDVSNFPKEGDDKPVHLDNSNYAVFDAEYAADIKANYQEIWDAGGNIEGNDQYDRLMPVVERGGKPDTDTEIEAVRKREAWAARHFADFQLAGVVAQMKWFVVGEQGEAEMKAVMDAEKEKSKGEDGDRGCGPKKPRSEDGEDMGEDDDTDEVPLTTESAPSASGGAVDAGAQSSDGEHERAIKEAAMNEEAMNLLRGLAAKVEALESRGAAPAVDPKDAELAQLRRENDLLRGVRAVTGNGGRRGAAAQAGNTPENRGSAFDQLVTRARQGDRGHSSPALAAECEAIRDVLTIDLDRMSRRGVLLSAGAKTVVDAAANAADDLRSVLDAAIADGTFERWRSAASAV